MNFFQIVRFIFFLIQRLFIRISNLQSRIYILLDL